jgi:hypothetical protein
MVRTQPESQPLWLERRRFTRPVRSTTLLFWKTIHTFTSSLTSTFRAIYHLTLTVAYCDSTRFQRLCQLDSESVGLVGHLLWSKVQSNSLRNYSSQHGFESSRIWNCTMRCVDVIGPLGIRRIYGAHKVLRPYIGKSLDFTKRSEILLFNFAGSICQVFVSGWSRKLVCSYGSGSWA